jgi:hypothetical protein
MTIRFCPASPLRSLHKAFPPIVFNDVHAFAKSDWCPGPSLAGCPVGRLRELEVFDPSQVLYDVLAIGIPHVDAVSKTRAIVYRHFSLPQSSSASRFTAGASRFLNLSRMVTFLHCSLLPELSGVAVVPEVPDRKASRSNLSSRTEVGSYLVAVCRPAHLGKTELCPIPNLRIHATDLFRQNIAWFAVSQQV